MTSVVPPLIYSLPLAKRPSPSLVDYAATLAFNAVFQLGMVGLHAVQLCILPLHLSPATMPYFNTLARWTEGLYARLLILIAMVWAPTVIRVTVDDDDDELDLRKIVQRNEKGIAIGLDLPDRMVMMSNHQVRSLAVRRPRQAACLTYSVAGILRLVVPLVFYNEHACFS